MKIAAEEAKLCPKCRKPIARGALSGLCPACLLAQGADSETADSPDATPFVPPTVEEVARLFPSLEILGLLGAGGMGAVYKARQPALDRMVALKILPSRGVAGGNFPERFNREARALARLSHPNIVAVHEFGEMAGLHYFIMEFVDGANLRQLEQANRLSPREALQIIPQICDALQYAHDEGVVHRDIKPENVLVDRKGRVKIADFGLAKILGRDPESTRLTAEGQVMGTPHYMAPEQLERPLAVDHRADIYSLGVVLYEMLTGDLPLGKFAPPSRKVEVDVRFDEVVLRALENDPARRYQNASEVKSEVQTIASTPGQPVAPAVPGPRAEFLRWADFPVVMEREGARKAHWKGVMLALAVIFGLLTVAFGVVSAITGRSLLGWIGIIGWPSVVARLLIAGGIVAFGVRRAWNRPRGRHGTVFMESPRPWWRRRGVVLGSVVVAIAAWMYFEARWLAPQPGTGYAPSGIKVAQQAIRDSATGRLVVQLPGRGTVELLAVGDPGTAWWTPDGEAVRDTFEVPNPVESSATGRVAKDVLFRVRDLPDGASMAGSYAEPPSGMASGAEVFRNGKPLSGAFQARFAWPPSLRKADLQMGFGLAPWRTIGTISASGRSQNQRRQPDEPSWRLNFHHQPTDTAEGAQVALFFGPENRMWVHRVVAVDTNGVEHTANSGQGTPVENVTLWTYTFGRVRLAELKEFQVQVRPVHWVEFPQVALRPRDGGTPVIVPTFSPVVEVTLSQMIDFDSGATRNYPWPIPPPATAGRTETLPTLEPNVGWMQQNGFDAGVQRGGEFQPLEMDFVLLTGADWRDLNAAELMKRVYRNYYRPHTIKPKADELPATFGFRTREQGAGMMQIIAYDEEKPSVTLRYRMVQRAGSAGRPRAQAVETSWRAEETPVKRPASDRYAASDPKAEAVFAKEGAPLDEPPRLRFLAWQDEWKKATAEAGRSSRRDELPRVLDTVSAAWRPDGSAVTNPAEMALLRMIPPSGMNVSDTELSRRRPHFLHLWFSHPQFNLQGLNHVTLLDTKGVPLPLDADGSTASRTHLEGTNGRWLICTSSPGEGDRIPRAISVQLRYTLGPLERTVDVPPDYSGAMSLRGNSQLNGIGQDADGRSFVAISVDVAKSEREHFAVVAITRDGRELAASGNSTSGHVGSPLRAERFMFNTPLAEIASFRIGTRPIRTMEWKNVILRPPSAESPAAGEKAAVPNQPSAGANLHK